MKYFYKIVSKKYFDIFLNFVLANIILLGNKFFQIIVIIIFNSLELKHLQKMKN